MMILTLDSTGSRGSCIAVTMRRGRHAVEGQGYIGIILGPFTLEFS